MGRCTFPLLLALATPFVSVWCQPPTGDAWFESEVRPLLLTRCGGCHGPDHPKGDLRLDHGALAQKGGASGPAVIPGRPDESRLMRAVRYQDVALQMPPSGRLTDLEIATLERWIREGAPWPDEPIPSGEGPPPFDLAGRRSAHWCWRPIERKTPPSVSQSDWPRDPLDRFVLARLEEHGISPAPTATQDVLARRLSFALTGLPPDPEDVEAFLADPSEDAWSRLVDRWLASPHFGERWARHWLDCVRYAESYGHEFDYPIPEAWRYRDYVIRALNADVPFDQWISEHVAGDLLPEPRLHPQEAFNESVLGTGFWHFHQATHGPVDVVADAYERIDNQVDVFSKTFLGLTVACARCHDHKFDAISTEDYYALAGYLASSRRDLAVLDPGGAFAAAAKSVDDLRARADAILSEAKLGSAPDRRLHDAAQSILAALPVSSQPIEAEDLASRAVSHGDYRPQDLDGKWTGRRHMWWTGGKIGSSLEMDLPISAAGTYRIVGRFTKARDYGRFRVSLNGHLLREELDLYDPNVVPTAPVTLGTVQLEPGQNRLRFEITGAHPDALPSYMLGLDWIRVDPEVDLDAVVAQHAESQHLDGPSLRTWIVAQKDPDFRTGDFDQLSGSVLSAEVSPAETRDWLLVPGQGDGWMASGPAWVRGAHWAPTGELGSTQVGTWSSRARGEPFVGTLRSPSFLIAGEGLAYRVAAKKGRVRIIIEGYFLDDKNALLFEGLTRPLDTDGQWTWFVHTGDLGRYRGRYAHVEFSDDGEGWVDVDAVVPLRSADQHPPPLAEPSCTVVTTSGAGRSMPTRVLDWAIRHGFVTLDRTRLQELSAQCQACTQDLPTPPRALALCDGSPRDVPVAIRGQHQNPGPVAGRRFIEALGGREQPVGGHRSGRLELAAQLTADENPLVARVFVNRVWHHLFGTGIVPTVDDFGALGVPPTDLALLDELAAGFRTDGWSMKGLIRRVVLSSTYRMASDPREPQVEALAQRHQLLHRQSVRRLDAEALRDALLSAAGALDPTLYGPPVAQHLTPFMTGRGRPSTNGPMDGNGRRSLYRQVLRNFLDPFTLAFDGPIPHTTEGRRHTSNVPAQALTLLNDPFVRTMARRMGKRARTLGGEDPAQGLQHLFELAWSRRPEPEEKAAAWEFLKDAQDSEAAFADLAHALINAKAFAFVR